MRKKQIQIQITPDGEAHVDFQNFPSQSCQAEEKRIRDTLAQCGLFLRPKKKHLHDSASALRNPTNSPLSSSFHKLP